MNIDLARAVLNPSWQFVKEHFMKQREMRITALLNTLDADESNLLKGQIRELDTLLRLTDQSKQFVKERNS